MNTSKAVRWLAIVAVLFGALTIASGARALFGGAEAQSALGNIVPFVLWFNFAAGFVYLLAGGGLLANRRWGAYLALLLAVATVAVFAAFGAHALSGGAFETRTVMAMTLRSLFWIAVAALAYRALLRAQAVA